MSKLDLGYLQVFVYHPSKVPSWPIILKYPDLIADHTIVIFHHFYVNLFPLCMNRNFMLI